MKVDKSHHIDKSEPDADGMYEFYYDYHIYEFTAGNQRLVARRYKNEAEAHFLRLETESGHSFLSENNLNEPLVLQAIKYLKNEGIESLSYLDENIGYIEI